MINWLFENMSTIVVLLIVLGTISLILGRMIKDKKKGSKACGCGCSDCPMSGKCHSQM
ncbi:MAG TPA: FeoB-associated Cys-rich membrane protein [Lachnospiraceae bacterium]|nr:FeoB-associated Cys-rich membrane protein [Lachnospiraceae bacterium]HPF30413.1 FeoB-associated Cys-rich membrane protein [Lachnospiraceae bacterium]